MITTKELESIGWEHYATSANGGSKSFRKGNGLFVLNSNADNFLHRKNKDNRLNEIEIYVIQSFPSLKKIIKYKGEPNLEELKQKMLEFGI